MHELLECSFCGETNIPYGAVVCRGCQAEILYGPTGQERMQEGCVMGLFSGCALGGCVCVPLLAILLAAVGILHDRIPPWFEWVSFIIVASMAVLFGVWFERDKGSNDHRVRFVRRKRYL